MRFLRLSRGLTLDRCLAGEGVILLSSLVSTLTELSILLTRSFEFLRLLMVREPFGLKSPIFFFFLKQPFGDLGLDIGGLLSKLFTSFASRVASLAWRFLSSMFITFDFSVWSLQSELFGELSWFEFTSCPGLIGVHLEIFATVSCKVSRPRSNIE